MDKPNYETSDMYEIAYILMKVKPLFIQAQGKRVLYTFPPHARQFSDEYWTGNTNVNIRHYVASLRSTKDYIFSKLRQYKR